MKAAFVLTAIPNRRAERIVPTRGIAQGEEPEETAKATGRLWNPPGRPHGTETL
jgi:hypothetical protein